MSKRREPDDGPYVEPKKSQDQRTWLSLDERDQEALGQLLDRAERAGEIKGLTKFIRTLLRQDGIPAVVATVQEQTRRYQRRHHAKRLREARTRR